MNDNVDDSDILPPFDELRRQFSSHTSLSDDDEDTTTKSAAAAAAALIVLSKHDEGYFEAISSRSFNLNLLPTYPKKLAEEGCDDDDDDNDDDGNSNTHSISRYPDGVIIASTTEAVVATVKFCRRHNIRISVRTGGHNWFSIWLQGKRSIILDVGDLDEIEDVVVVDNDATVVAGPGAKDLNRTIQPEWPEWFFPTGHCPQVPLGGFILGGGFGIGFQKYGMACSRVVAMEVVLASGKVRWVSSEQHSGGNNDNDNGNDNDEIEDAESQALMDLMRGSYHYFPAVITKYKLSLCKSPKCVLPQNLVFSLEDWRLAIKYGRDIAHRGDDHDSFNIETTIVFCHAPPDILEQTGKRKVVILSLMVWSDEDETSTRRLLKKYTHNVKGLLVPLTPDMPIQAQDVAESFHGLYPKCRYHTAASFGDSSSVLQMSDDEICNLLLPLANTWLSKDDEKNFTVPKSPSHSLVVLMNKNLNEVNGRCDLATGFIPGIEVMSYAIYDNPELDDLNRRTIQRSMDRIQQSEHCRTAFVEGDILNTKSNFFASSDTKERMDHKIQLLDPDGLFKKKW